MEQILGPLELKIMTVLWHLDRGTVRDVLERLSDSPKPAYTTVMTVMVRLHDKGLLDRSRHGNSFVYVPTLSQQGLVEDASRKAVHRVLERFGDLAVAHFLEEAKLSTEHIVQLGELAESDEKQNER